MSLNSIFSYDNHFTRKQHTGGLGVAPGSWSMSRLKHYSKTQLRARLGNMQRRMKKTSSPWLKVKLQHEINTIKYLLP